MWETPDCLNLFIFYFFNFQRSQVIYIQKQSESDTIDYTHENMYYVGIIENIIKIFSLN